MITKNDRPDPQGLKRETASEKPFSKTNYYFMAGCLTLIVVGFILMSGGGSSSETGFNPEIFSTRRIVVGPLLAFLGFLLMAFAIVWHPKKKLSLKNEKVEIPEDLIETETLDQESTLNQEKTEE